jgi:tetratricopeptide (TPR) repeat protein
LEEFSTKGDAMISPAVTAALGNAYANTGNIDKAISTLKKAADMADDEVEDGVNNSLSPTYLIQAARLLESQGKKDEALKIYKDIKVKYINSVAAQDIDKYIERIGE